MGSSTFFMQIIGFVWLWSVVLHMIGRYMKEGMHYIDGDHEHEIAKFVSKSYSEPPN